MQVLFIWECEYDKLRETDEELKSFLEDHYYGGEGDRPRERLAVRGALKGGRTEAFALLFLVENDPSQIILYLDNTSLYPWVAIMKL